MKKNIVKLFCLFIVAAMLLSGCGEAASKEKTPTGGKVAADPQAVVAFQPTLDVDGEKVVAFNEINSAVTADKKANTLDKLDDTNWCLLRQEGAEWEQPAVYDLGKWHNGDKTADSKLLAYSFNKSGSIALMCYNKDKVALKAIGNESFPASGVLLASSGDKQIGLCYVADADATVTIPEGTLTALDSVGGVATNFLDSSDGSVRTVSVKLLVNDKVLWSDVMGNQAAEDGSAVSTLTYPEFADLSLKEGDIVSFSIQLNGTAAEADYTEGEDTPSGPKYKTVKRTVTETEYQEIPKTPTIKAVTGYDSTFRIVYPANASATLEKSAMALRRDLELLINASVEMYDDSEERQGNEILVGETNRAASGDAYSRLRGYRTNCANDFAITMTANQDITVAAGSQYALDNAIEYLLKNVIVSDKNKIPTNLDYVSRPTVGNITIGGKKATEYVIRTEQYPSLVAKRAAVALQDYLITAGGVEVAVENDQTTTASEILVGLTTRSVGAEIFKDKSLDFVKDYDPEDFNVFFKDGKLFVEAGSDYAANYAVVQLINKLKSDGALASTYTNKGSVDKKAYEMTDGYSYAWGDEFYDTDKNVDSWEDIAPTGTEGGPPFFYPSAKLVEDLLAPGADPTLKSLLSAKLTDSSHGDYYSFSKKYFGGVAGGCYGTKDNLLFQNYKFDTKKGYWGSHLQTTNTMHFRYGIFEVRAKFAAVPGVSSTLWLAGRSGLVNYQEIDLIESFGSKNLVTNLHTWGEQHINHGASGDYKAVSMSAPNGELWTDRFHYLAMEWDADMLDIYLDGELVSSCDQTDGKWDAFEQKIDIRIGCEVGGGFYMSNGLAGAKGGIDELLNTQATQYYDFLRIYQKSTGKQRVWTYGKK